MSDFKSTFGESVINFADMSSNVGESFISTGSRSLNNILTGNSEIGIVQRRIYEIYGPEGCISGKSFIPFETRTEDGKRINHKGGRIQNLYKKFHSNKNSVFFVSSVNDENRIIKQEILDVVKTGFKECFELETVSGHKIIATDKHNVIIEITIFSGKIIGKVFLKPKSDFTSSKSFPLSTNTL